jgi:hypothetical protein
MIGALVGPAGAGSGAPPQAESNMLLSTSTVSKISNLRIFSSFRETSGFNQTLFTYEMMIDLYVPCSSFTS